MILFASFVLPAGYEISSQQDPNSQVQKKERKRDGTHKVKQQKKKQKKNKKKKNKKIKKNKKQRKGRR